VAKSAEAFRTISEASKELGVPQHVLRHWEEVFGHVRPMRRAGGRRYYRPVDLDLLRGVRVLLYDERYTTKGVQKIFRENGMKYVTELGKRVSLGEKVDVRGEVTTADDHPSQEDDKTSSKVSSGSDKVVSTSDIIHDTDSGTQSVLMEHHLGVLKSLLARLEKTQDELDNAILAIEAISLLDDTKARSDGK